MLAPFAPVAFLNPPIVHRTEALRAKEAGERYQPARYREGEDIGTGSSATVSALRRSGVQRTILWAAHAPLSVRRPFATGLKRILPASGTGPSGRFLTDWKWTVHADVRTRDGLRGEVFIDGQGHPGYAATARMIAEIGMRIALGRAPDRYGCLTPALALGSLDLDPWFVDGLRLR